MIDERMEEQASLYVLGGLTPEEQQAFEADLSHNVELHQLVNALRVSRDALAGNLPEIEPPFELKQRILAQISPAQKVVARAAPNGSFLILNLWFPWGLAACLAVVCGMMLTHEFKLKDQLTQQSTRLQAMNQMADDLRSTTNSLHQMVLSLRETNQLANLRIAMLNSLLADAPKAIAVSLWDNEKQKGVFVVQNLKPLPTDKDYQLWVLDPKYPTPVSAGVFQVDDQGNVRIQFKVDKLVDKAEKFAVTMEPKGGLTTPTMKDLVLIGS